MTASTRTLNGTKKSPAIASRNSGMRVERLRPVAQRVDAALLCSLDADARVPHHPGRLRHQLGLLTGMVPPELEDEVLVPNPFRVPPTNHQSFSPSPNQFANFQTFPHFMFPTVIVKGTPSQVIPSTPGNTPESRAESAATASLQTSLKSSTSPIPSFPSTAYIGNIAAGITDETMEAILQALTTVKHNGIHFAGLKKWKRVQDASGQPKHFGFAEFTGAPAVGRAKRLLDGMTILRNKLVVKVDESTERMLVHYEGELEGEVGVGLNEYYYSQDLSALQALCPVIAERGLSASLEGIEELMKNLRSKYVDRRQPPTEIKKEEEARPAPVEHQRAQPIPRALRAREEQEGVFRERLRIHEQRERAMQRQREDDEQRERDRMTRLEGERQEVLQAYAAFDDTPFFSSIAENDDAKVEAVIRAVAALPARYRRVARTADLPIGALFYLDREKWQRERQEEMAREKERDEKEEQEERERMSRRDEERLRWEQHINQDLDFLHQHQRASLPKEVTDEERIGGLVEFRKGCKRDGTHDRNVKEQLSKLASLIPMDIEVLLQASIPWHKWAAFDRRWHQLGDIFIARVERLVLTEHPNRASITRALHSSCLSHFHALRRLVSHAKANDPKINGRVFNLIEDFVHEEIPRNISRRDMEELGSVLRHLPMKWMRRWVFEAEAESCGMYGDHLYD